MRLLKLAMIFRFRSDRREGNKELLFHTVHWRDMGCGMPDGEMKDEDESQIAGRPYFVLLIYDFFSTGEKTENLDKT